VDELLHRYHKLPLTLLVRGRLISILAIAFLLVASFLLLDLLAGLLTALLVIGMVVLDPFFLGHSRLLNHEALMASAILLSMLAALTYLYSRRQARYLALSGAAAGLALLVKVPAIVLLPLVGLMFLVRLIEDWKGAKTILRYAAGLALWALVAAGVYILLWPGMWVAPGTMLYEVFGNALSNAFQGGRLAATQGLHPETYALDSSGIILYLKLVFLKTTPLVWLGGVLALVGLFVKNSSRISKLIVVYFALLSLSFVIMFGLAQGRNHQHYILTAFIALDVVAGVGLSWGYGWLSDRAPVFHKRMVQLVVLGSLLLLHGLGALPHYPYYYTYTNPLAGAVMGGDPAWGTGYGEGLELAGAYLAHKPGAADLKVMSWYAAGPFSYYFPGQTYNLLISPQVEDDYIERMKASDYLVIYSILQKQLNMPQKLLESLKSIPPEHTIWIDGQEYIQIYRVEDFSDEFFASIRNE
jgi:4-amino-4-deoxy-L-arabinose transferase-like glycosyltransferase